MCVCVFLIHSMTQNGLWIIIYASNSQIPSSRCNSIISSAGVCLVLSEQPRPF